MLESYTTEAKILRDRAMGKLQKANTDFIHRAMDAIERVASRRREFIVDQVWDELVRVTLLGAQQGTGATDNRAMGVAMREAAKLGIIRPTGFYRASNQPQCHANPRRVWESLVYYE